MFRVLGALVVALIVGILLLLLLFRTVIWPAMNRKRLEELERENERLDRLLASSEPQTPTKE
jgi:hypothetical protein